MDIRISVGRHLIHDWVSRGILAAAAEEYPIKWQEHYNRSFVEGPPGFIAGLVFDTEHQLEPYMGAEPTMRRTMRKFVDDATVALANWHTRQRIWNDGGDR